VVTVEDTMISGLPMPDAVSVLVSTELLAQLEADWSPPIQIQLTRTPGIGSGYEMVCRTHQVDGETSDGQHTFDELYQFRMLYNAALFNSWSGFQNKPSGVFDVHKSWRHHDGELCFGGGWFIVMAQLPTGQISNHYPAKDWDLFRIPEREVAAEWDGHNASEVADRLQKFLTP
jgi:hypothetical protein